MTDKKIKAVVFDLDHTLYDRYATLGLVCRDMMSMHPEWFADGVSLDYAQSVMAEADGRFITGGWAPVLAFWIKKGLLETDGSGKTIADEREIFDFIWNYGFLKYAVKYPFTNPMLDTLRAAGLKTALLTNAAGEKGIARQYAKLRLLDLEGRFDNVLVTAQVGIHKPDRGVFDIMKWRLGIPAENMLYVGDHPINDVLGSKRAGYTPVWVRLREEYGETAECEYSVRDVSEIPAIVEKING